jgi:hypothetical protein
MTALPVGPAAAVHDFDFLFGRWTVRHRRLVTRGAGADDWDAFDGTAFTEPRMGGISNIEQHDCPARGWRGVALRTLDLAAGDWSIYWISDRDGRLSPPVVGRFQGDGCRLEGPDTDGGRPVVARYEWSRIGSGAPRWEQHFSYDGGATWELNWVMDFSRAAA